MPETKAQGHADMSFAQGFAQPSPEMMYAQQFAQGLPPQHPQVPPQRNNPLAQYFRRPAIHLRLPSGTNYYTPDVVAYPPTGELPVYPMTAIDEITARTPDSAFNGSAVVDIIESCVPAIKNAWMIGLHDLDAILTAIKIATLGEKMEVTSVCTSCGNRGEFDIDLQGVLASLSASKFNIPLPLRDFKIKFRPLTYDELNTVSIEQYGLQKSVRNIQDAGDELSDQDRAKMIKEALSKLGELNTTIATTAIEYISLPDGTIVDDKNYIHDYLINAPKEDYNEVLTLFAQIREPSQVQPMTVKCPECNNEYKQTFSVNPTDFFD